MNAVVGPSPGAGDAGRDVRGKVLFVDDEKNILSSLKRLARRLGYDPYLAESGAQALEFLTQQEVDVIVSDMRMPGMNGAEFLEQAAKLAPATERVLLTGYSDIDSAAAAVNKGRIYRYLGKPWNDDELAATLDQAIQVRSLRLEKQRLTELVQAQNEELLGHNAALEDKVQARTKELSRTLEQLASKNRQLQDSYEIAVDVFANLIQSKAAGASSIRENARRARQIGKRVGLDERRVKDVYLASLLCDLGKLVLPDALQGKPYLEMTAAERGTFHQHPTTAASALMPLSELQAVANILQRHCEYLDGSGFPDKLSGAAIPVEAQILCVVKDFSALQNGKLVGACLTAAESIEYLKVRQGKKYNAQVVTLLAGYLEESEEQAAFAERRITTAGLHAGMTVSRDCFNDNGVLLLPAGLELKQEMLERLRVAEQTQESSFVIYVTPRSIEND